MTVHVEHLSDTVTLYRGDCREILPTLPRPAAIIADPPYGIGRSGQDGIRGRKRGRVNSRTVHIDLEWDSERVSAQDVERLKASTDKLIIWGGNYYADLLPASTCWLIWNKGQSLKQADAELAWTNLPGSIRSIEINRCEIGQDAAYWRGPSYHPTQKPIALMSWCVAQARVPAGGVICDPYMGAGSTGVAAVRAGHPFIGMELEPLYFDTACRRIADDLCRPRLFAAAAPEDLPVASLFGPQQGRSHDHARPGASRSPIHPERPPSPADICRERGWKSGTKLAAAPGDGEAGPTIIEITGLGTRAMLAKAVLLNGSAPSYGEPRQWALHRREWREVRP